MIPILSIWSRDSQAKRFVAEPPRRRILVVEDDLIICAIAAEALEETGYEVLTAASAEEAEVILSQDVMDILFTDIDLGGRDGCELASRACAMQPGLAVIFTSGRSLRCLGGLLPAGASFLAKPYRLQDLIHEIDRTAAEAAYQ